MKNNLSKNLKKLRKEEGLSQEQLADLLSVSRQSVSKWETEDAYPEMDKIIFLCNNFNLDINDLLNGDIYEVRNKNEAIKDVYKVIDKIVKFFSDLFSLFLKMTFKSKIKFILELMFFIGTLSLVFLLLGTIGSGALSYFYNLPNKLYYGIRAVVSFVYYVITIVLGSAIMIEIIKNRYLKYYRDNKMEEKETPETEEIKKDKIEIKENNTKVIIRDVDDGGYKISKFLYKILVFFFKSLFVIILIPIIILLIFLAFAFVSSFLVNKTGLFFVGIILITLSALIITTFILLLIINFLFNRKNNFKVFIYTTVINIIIFGLGIGSVFLGAMSFNITNEYDSKTFQTIEHIITMNENLIVEDAYIQGDIEYIEELRKDIRIEYEYNGLVYLGDGTYANYDEDGEYIMYVHPGGEININGFKTILKNLNETKTINYSDKLYNFKIYASKQNLNMIKHNIEKNN